MNTEIKASVNLGARASVNPPVRFAKARNSKPSNNKYVFTPKGFGQLKESVLKVDWNAATSSLKITIKETAKFEVYKWMQYTVQQNHEREKSPFVDVDNNSATLSFLDENEVMVATIRFKNLVMKDHKCDLSKQHNNFVSSHEHLLHELEFTYGESDVTFHADEMEGTPEEIEEFFKDGEWQTVETPA